MRTTDVLVAGRPLWEFGAKMIADPTITAEIDSVVFQGLERSSLQPLHVRTSGQTMECMIDYYGDPQTRARNRGALEALLISPEPVEIDICDGFFYKAVIEKISHGAIVGSLIESVQYRFRVTKHTAPVRVDVTSAWDYFRFLCQSTVPLTDCKITIPYDQSVPISSLTQPLILLNDQAWQFKTGFVFAQEPEIVLDGINKIFLMNSSNITNSEQFRWSDFPALVPGVNTISISTDGYIVDVPAVIEYTPTYL